VPAWLTYKITPDQKIFVAGSWSQGPLGKLTVRATGAFAAYFVVLLCVTKFILPNAQQVIQTKLTPAWTLDADLQVIGRDGKTVAIPPNLELLDVSYKPVLLTVGSNHVTLRLPGYPADWPSMIFTIPGYGGSGPVFPKSLSKLKVDISSNHADLGEPLVIRQSKPKDEALSAGLPGN
jgi:hypothetical protein